MPGCRRSLLRELADDAPCRGDYGVDGGRNIIVSEPAGACWMYSAFLPLVTGVCLNTISQSLTVCSVPLVAVVSAWLGLTRGELLLLRHIIRLHLLTPWAESRSMHLLKSLKSNDSESMILRVMILRVCF